MEELSLDTQAILLLCARLDRSRAAAVTPLTNEEYAAFAVWLAEEGVRPADLVQIGGRSHLHAYGRLDPERLERLLDRGTQLALQVETWARKGIWVVSRGDAAYPRRWKQRLGHAAPPLVHGVGARTLLNRGGVALLGTRAAPEETLAYARALAEHAAASGLDVIAGGEKGVESAGMHAAIACEGSTVGVVAQSLERMSLEPSWRDGLVRGDLALICVDGPRARAGAAGAAARMPLLYALADHVLVVSATHGRGATWAGLVANGEAPATPVFACRPPGALPSGNEALLAAGAPALAPEALLPGADLGAWLRTHAVPPPRLAATPGAAPQTGAARSRPTRQAQRPPQEKDPAQGQLALGAAAPTAPAASGEVGEAPTPEDLFPLAWARLRPFLERPRTVAHVSRHFGLTPTQAKAWLERAAGEGRAVRRGQPVRYRALGE